MIDETDKRLIVALQEAPRASVSVLARRLGLARSTVQTRLTKLEQSGVIAGYALRLGPAYAGGQIGATALLRVQPKTIASVIRELYKLPQVRRARSTSGRFDLALTIKCFSPEDLDQILDQIGQMTGVIDSESLIHLSTKFER